jgi:hypothetical protein
MRFLVTTQSQVKLLLSPEVLKVVLDIAGPQEQELSNCLILAIIKALTSFMIAIDKAIKLNLKEGGRKLC